MSAVPRLGAGRLSTNQLAYLRAIAQGLSVEQAARRYLDIEHGAEIASAHRLVVERGRRRLCRSPTSNEINNLARW